MKRMSVLAAGLLPLLLPGFAQSASSAAGNGPYVVPTAALYDDLSRLAARVKSANDAAFVGATIVIYDPQAFGILPMYPSGVRQFWAAMDSMCDITERTTPITAEAASDVLSGAGAAASGLGALITAVTPNFAIQGQSITIDNNALIAAFVKIVGNNAVVIPAYLPAATASSTPDCNNYRKSSSFTALWEGAAAEILKVKIKLKDATSDAKKKEIQAVIDSYQAMRDGYLASDKGPSLYSKVTAAESLWNALNGKAGKTPLILDLKLDLAGIDSTTTTELFWKTTRFSDDLLAHYFLFSIQNGRLQLENEDTVTVMTKDKNVKRYGSTPKLPGKQTSTTSSNRK